MLYLKGTFSSLFASYRMGEGVDMIAGVEAIISHIITKELLIPCAHAPAFAATEIGKLWILTYHPINY